MMDASTTAPQEGVMRRTRLTARAAERSPRPALSLALLLAAFVAATQLACALVRSGLSL
jgi:hypothetical protein